MAVYFYQTKYWKTIRKVLLEKNNFTCSKCGFVGQEHGEHYKRTAMVVHHLKSRSSGGGEHPDNLEVLCNKCHARLSRNQK